MNNNYTQKYRIYNYFNLIVQANILFVQKINHAHAINTSLHTLITYGQICYN